MTGTVNNRPIAAALSMLGAMAMVTFIDNFIGAISEQVSVWQFHMMRSIAMFPLILIMSFAGLGTLRPQRWLPVLARSVVITCSMMLYFGALGMMPIAQAVAGLFTSPIFVLLINVLVMKRRIGPWRVAAVFIGFSGILMVLQPGNESFGWQMFLPVSAGMFYAVSSIATRSWCAGESALTLLGANMVMLWLVGSVVTLALGLSGSTGENFLNRAPTLDIMPLLPVVLLQAVGSVLGVFLIIRAYQLDEPTNVAVFEYSALLFAPLFAFLLFGQSLGMLQAIGILMIAGAGVIIAVRST